MNTRQAHLRRELAVVEQSINGLQTQLNEGVRDARVMAATQANLEVLERRRRTLQGLIVNCAGQG